MSCCPGRGRCHSCARIFTAGDHGCKLPEVTKGTVARSLILKRIWSRWSRCGVIAQEMQTVYGFHSSRIRSNETRILVVWMPTGHGCLSGSGNNFLINSHKASGRGGIG
jgi:hypothetical protein